MEYGIILHALLPSGKSRHFAFPRKDRTNRSKRPTHIRIDINRGVKNLIMDQLTQESKTALFGLNTSSITTAVAILELVVDKTLVGSLSISLSIYLNISIKIIKTNRR